VIDVVTDENLLGALADAWARSRSGGGVYFVGAGSSPAPSLVLSLPTGAFTSK
jgi:hypothetical protein